MNFVSTGRRIALVSLVALTAACGGGGGGGGGGGSVVTPPPTGGGGSGGGSTDPVWVQGTYEAASTFDQRCENPRSGVDIEGNAFPDVQGSTTIENFWLRSWTNETYLWNDEVTDRNPASFDNRVEYFNLLRTTAVTSSGEDKDDFHFSQSTEDFLASRNSAGTASYGFSLAALRSSPPRDFRIRYVDPDTPASEEVSGQQQFLRGTRILSVDGEDLVNGSDTATLNAGLFPSTAGETHTFEVQDEGSSTPRTVTIVSEDLARKPVIETQVIDRPGGEKVGYIVFNTFSPFASEEEIVNAIQTLATAGVDDLVLDLRYNGGGLLAVASQLSYMLAGPTFTDGKYFEVLQFNDDAGAFNPVTGERNDPVPFYETTLGFSTTSGQPLPRLDLNRVFILSTGGTCSASEAVVNGLRGIDFEVVLIGDITCGKPYGFYPTDNCGETYYTIQFAGVNFKGFGDYADGFVPEDNSFSFGARLPGCTVADDLAFALGDTSEPLLAAALTYRETGSCPVTTTTSTAFSTQSFEAPVKGQDIQVPVDLMSVNRDMRLPNGDAL
ncbi:peptidase [Parvularcula sp. ZS-1/3]|uniref:Peptidase n=1 Tax=Parvularcula mediterranea TaxID=2732508 RepID=A0A7Y3W450_9PROT|nr:S41 family peptidase [Parvularcula mediterranea]NNU15410.1 peptidase [Parvularcula mediterranea]